MRDGRGLVRAGLVSLLLVLLLAQPGFAYLGQTKYSVTVSAAFAVVKCGTSVRLTATVLKTETNAPAKGVTVRWAIKSSPSDSDRLNDSSTRTNNNGQAGVTLRLGDREGTRVIKARVDGASGTTTVTCKKDHHHQRPPIKCLWLPASKWFHVPVRSNGWFWAPIGFHH